MDITFILQQRNQEERDQLLKDLYDPSSSVYRQFLTVEQFTEKFGPSREDYETVKAFARADGFQILSDFPQSHEPASPGNGGEH